MWPWQHLISHSFDFSLFFPHYSCARPFSKLNPRPLSSYPLHHFNIPTSLVIIMWYLPLCIYALRQSSLLRRFPSPHSSLGYSFFFSCLSCFWICHLWSSTLQYSDHHCEELSLMIFFFFSYLSSHCSSIPLPPARPFLSRFNSLQPGACCAVLDCDGEESWFSLFNQLSYFFSLFSVPVLVCPAFSPYFHPPSILLYQLRGTLSVLCSSGPTAQTTLCSASIHHYQSGALWSF